MKNILLIFLCILIATFGAYLAYNGFAMRGATITDLDGNEIRKFRTSFTSLLIVLGLTSIIGGITFSALNLKRLLTKGGAR